MKTYLVSLSGRFDTNEVVVADTKVEAKHKAMQLLRKRNECSLNVFDAEVKEVKDKRN